MLDGMWQNWDINALLVELWIDPTILEGNLELCSKSYKRLSALWYSHATTGFIPQRGHGKTTCAKIFIVTLFVVAKNWKMRECPSIWEWLNKMWYLLVMEYYCAQRNNELEEFHVNWNDLQELRQSERSRTRRTLNTETDTLWYNWT